MWGNRGIENITLKILKSVSFLFDIIFKIPEFKENVEGLQFEPRIYGLRVNHFSTVPISQKGAVAHWQSGRFQHQRYAIRIPF